ncbi:MULTISPECIES: erythromycin resistance leader peptide [Paenibacillus]|uniref:Uncharacterized protein n=1 Tax=Paenibacillus macerans TaxID=44252 RepID=A0A6N8EYH1_PAEMA|nr:erythromycin resistance leader peptide [Paenibacillus macerans]MUG23398.1 hypothetical protein [Paenibacillus macerans]
MTQSIRLRFPTLNR